eukprot:Em0009g465a
MEKYLVPEPIGEGELSDQWIWFKRLFDQFLTAIGKANASGGIKLAICFKLRESRRTIDQFVTELRKKVKDYEFGTLKDDLMLHVLIRGLDSERMRRHLFETDNLELPKAIRMCQGIEADLQSWGEAKNGSPEVVAAVKGTTKESLDMKMVKLDSAATCNVLSHRDYLKLGKPRQEHSSITLTMYDGSVRRSMRMCTLQLAAEAISQLKFEVLDTKHHSLLSLDTCLKLGLLKYNMEEVCIVHSDQELTHSRICEEYLDLFSGIGCLPGEYDIELDSAIPPVQN